jgi:hypothetical protein
VVREHQRTAHLLQPWTIGESGHSAQSYLEAKAEASWLCATTSLIIPQTTIVFQVHSQRKRALSGAHAQEGITGPSDVGSRCPSRSLALKSCRSWPRSLDRDVHQDIVKHVARWFLNKSGDVQEAFIHRTTGDSILS